MKTIDKFLKECQDKLIGLADKKGTTEKDVCPEQLKMGIEVEKEHTPDNKIKKDISLDHLTEDPKYYTHLKKMEDQAKKENKSIKEDIEKADGGFVVTHRKGPDKGKRINATKKPVSKEKAVKINAAIHYQESKKK